MAKDRPDEPCARVFISCGQRQQTDEAAVAIELEGRLYELGFDPYIAIQEQTLRGLKGNVFDRLSNSEYFIFVDFKREVLSSTNPPVHRGSLFSHQELALASYLEIPVIAFQESGVKQDDGILPFIQANAKQFLDRDRLASVIVSEVQQRGWLPNCRNDLVFERDPAQRGDSPFGLESFFHISVHNRHRHKTATNCCVQLKKVTKLDASREIECSPAELTWAGHREMNVSIPPSTSRKFDALHIRRDTPTEVRFQTSSTSPEFAPPILGTGRYELTYSVVTDNFPIACASFILNLDPSLSLTSLLEAAPSDSKSR
jgi:hypothetical protein